MDDTFFTLKTYCALSLSLDLTSLKQDHSLCGHLHLMTLLCTFQLWSPINNFEDSYLENRPK